jgi:hypothetical protein
MGKRGVNRFSRCIYTCFVPDRSTAAYLRARGAVERYAAIPLGSRRNILKKVQAGIDWDSLIARAAKRRLTLPLLDTLHYLREMFDAPVSSNILQKLGEIPVQAIERIEYKIAISPPTKNMGSTSVEITFPRAIKDDKMV